MVESLKWRLREWVTHGEPSRLISRGRELRGRIELLRGNRGRALQLGAAAARLRNSAGGRKHLESWLARVARSMSPEEQAGALGSAAITGNRLTKSVILKRPGSNGERGVLYIAAEGHWARLAQVTGRELSEEYALVIAPSWSLPHAPIHYAFPYWYNAPITVQLSNREDDQVFRAIHPLYRPVHLYASSWVDHRLYKSPPIGSRTIDLLMVANFHHFKRHFALFRALRDLPRSWRIVLAGQRERGRDAEDILREARSLGVEGRFDLRTDVAYHDIPALFENARASVVLSRREGSCVVVAESMFAGTPVGLLEDAWIGSKDYINPATGRLLRSSHLAADLRDLVETSASTSPRDWAHNNISFESSTRTLSSALQAVEHELGRPWTEDIRPMVWRPYPSLADGDPEMKAAHRAFESKYGLRLGMD